MNNKWSTELIINGETQFYKKLDIEIINKITDFCNTLFKEYGVDKSEY